MCRFIGLICASPFMIWRRCPCAILWPQITIHHPCEWHFPMTFHNSMTTLTTMIDAVCVYSLEIVCAAKIKIQALYFCDCAARFGVLCMCIRLCVPFCLRARCCVECADCDCVDCDCALSLCLQDGAGLEVIGSKFCTFFGCVIIKPYAPPFAARELLDLDLCCFCCFVRDDHGWIGLDWTGLDLLALTKKKQKKKHASKKPNYRSHNSN